MQIKQLQPLGSSRVGKKNSQPLGSSRVATIIRPPATSQIMFLSGGETPRNNRHSARAKRQKKFAAARLMDGYEATRIMRANRVTIPIVAFTANLPKEIEEHVKKTGINDIVVKPFLPDELYQKVLHHIS